MNGNIDSMQRLRQSHERRTLVAFLAIGALLLSQFTQVHFHVHHIDTQAAVHQHSFDLHAELLLDHEHDHAATTQLDLQQANLVKQLLGALSVALLCLLVLLALPTGAGGMRVTPAERRSPSRPHYRSPQLRAPPAPAP